MRHALAALFAVVLAVVAAVIDGSAAAPHELPQGSTQAPQPSTQAPRGSTELPSGSTQAPQGSTHAPQPSTQAPQPSTQAPQPSTQAPQPSTHAPQPSTQAPQPSTQAPQPSTQAPQPSTQAPQPSTQAPQGSTQAPQGSTQAPANSPSGSESNTGPTTPPTTAALSCIPPFDITSPGNVTYGNGKEIKIAAKASEKKSKCGFVKPYVRATWNVDGHFAGAGLSLVISDGLSVGVHSYEVTVLLKEGGVDGGHILVTARGTGSITVVTNAAADTNQTAPVSLSSQGSPSVQPSVVVWRPGSQWPRWTVVGSAPVYSWSLENMQEVIVNGSGPADAGVKQALDEQDRGASGETLLVRSTAVVPGLSVQLSQAVSVECAVPLVAAIAAANRFVKSAAFTAVASPAQVRGCNTTFALRRNWTLTTASGTVKATQDDATFSLPAGSLAVGDYRLSLRVTAAAPNTDGPAYRFATAVQPLTVSDATPPQCVVSGSVRVTGADGGYVNSLESALVHSEFVTSSCSGARRVTIAIESLHQKNHRFFHRRDTDAVKRGKVVYRGTGGDAVVPALQLPAGHYVAFSKLVIVNTAGQVVASHLVSRYFDSIKPRWCPADQFNATIKRRASHGRRLQFEARAVPSPALMNPCRLAPAQFLWTLVPVGSTVASKWHPIGRWHGRMLTLPLSRLAAGRYTLHCTVTLFPFNVRSVSHEAPPVDVVVGPAAPAGCSPAVTISGVPPALSLMTTEWVRVTPASALSCTKARIVNGEWNVRDSSGHSVFRTPLTVLAVPPRRLPVGEYRATFTAKFLSGLTRVSSEAVTNVSIRGAVVTVTIPSGNRRANQHNTVAIPAKVENSAPGDMVNWKVCVAPPTHGGEDDNCDGLAAVQWTDKTTLRINRPFLASKPRSDGRYLVVARVGAAWASVIVVVHSHALDVTLVGIPARPIANTGLVVFAVTHMWGATVQWHVAGHQVRGVGLRGAQLRVTADELRNITDGGTINVTADVTAAGGRTGHAEANVTVVRPVVGTCTAAAADGFSTIIAGHTHMEITTRGWRSRSVDAATFGYRFSYVVPTAGGGERLVPLTAQFGRARSLTFTAPVLLGNKGKSVEFVVSTMLFGHSKSHHARCAAFVSAANTSMLVIGRNAAGDMKHAAAGKNADEVVRAAGCAAVAIRNAAKNHSVTAPQIHEVRQEALAALSNVTAADLSKTQRGCVVTTLTNVVHDAGAMNAKENASVAHALGGLLSPPGSTEAPEIDDAAGAVGEETLKLVGCARRDRHGNATQRVLAQQLAIVATRSATLGNTTLRSTNITIFAVKLPVLSLANSTITAGDAAVVVPREAFGDADDSAEAAVTTVVHKHNPVPSAPPPSRVKLISHTSVVEVDVVADNKRRDVHGLKKPVQIFLKKPKGTAATCLHYDKGTRAWSDKSVKTVTVRNTGSHVVECHSTHLSLFAVGEAAPSSSSPDDSDSPTTVIALCAALGGLLVVGVVGFIAYKKVVKRGGGGGETPAIEKEMLTLPEPEYCAAVDL